MRTSRTGLDSELASFREVVERARRKSWRPSRSAGPLLTLRSTSVPNLEDYSALREMIAYAKNRDVTLLISGGGFGCFAIELAGGEGQGDALALLCADPQFQKLAAVFKVDEIWAEIGKTRTVHAQFLEFKILFGTNRKFTAHEGDPLLQYGDDDSEVIEFGFLQIQIPLRTLSKKSGVGSWVRSHWKRLAGYTETNKPAIRPEGSKLLRIEPDEFSGLLKEGHGKTIAHIHGYANNFRDAATAAATLFFNLEIGRLGMVPALFSWPSRGNPAAYDRDTVMAERSEKALLDFLKAARRAGGELSLVVHSHGNKLLMRALSDFGASAIPDRGIRNAFLCAPDVDKRVFEQKAPSVLRVLERASLYMSHHDRALWMSALKFGAERVGRTGAGPTAGGIEIVDASSASTGLLGHSYYTEAKTVINDLYYALMGLPAAKRLTVHPAKDSPGIWRLAD